jgi:uncharacterized membrane protein
MIEFTPNEMRLIERLRKQERQWRWARWMMLTMGACFIILCAFYGYALHFLISESRGHLDSDAVFLMMLFWTKCCMSFFFGIVFFIKAGTNWHGDANRKLLLRLVNDQSPVRAGA